MQVSGHQNLNLHDLFICTYNTQSVLFSRSVQVHSSSTAAARSALISWGVEPLQKATTNERWHAYQVVCTNDDFQISAGWSRLTNRTGREVIGSSYDY